MAYVMLAALVGLLAVAIVASFFKDRRYDKSVPHLPWTFPLVGNLPTLVMNRIVSDALTSAVDRAKYYNWGPIYVTVPGQGTELIFNDPESVQYVLSDNFDNYPNPEMRKIMGEEVWGDGIFMVNGEKWKMQRKLAKPIFTIQSIKQMIPIFDKHGTVLMDIVSENAKTSTHFDMQDLFKRYTLDTIGEIGFGVQIGSLHEPLPFSRAFDWVQEEVTRQFLMPGRKFLMRKQWKGALATLDNFVYGIIEARKADGIEGRGDLLSLYMAATDDNGEPLGDQFYRDALMNFLIAGRDTTSILLTWTFYFLSLNPKAEERLVQEVMDNFAEGESPTYTKLKTLKYLRMCLDEALRLYPPALPFMGKTAVKDDVLPNGVKVRGGQTVVYSAYVLHRTPKYWGDDAEEFRPERWEEEGLLKHPYQFVPFQKGPRICLGMDMAYLEASLVAVRILRAGYRLRIVPGQTLRCAAHITLPAESGTIVTAVKV